MKTWQLQEAKARLSEVVKKASIEGPQAITLRGEPAVVVISTHEYESLKRHPESLVDFIRRSPIYGIDLELKREQSLTRDIEEI